MSDDDDDESFKCETAILRSSGKRSERGARVGAVRRTDGHGWRLRAALLLLCVSACSRSKTDAPTNPTSTVVVPGASGSGAGRVAELATTSAPTYSGVHVTAPPADIVARFRLASFYKKYVDAAGLPIVASAQVPDFAMLEASFLVDKMVGGRPEIPRAMAENNVRLAIMAKTEMTTDIPEHSDLTPKDYWDRRARGLGATERRPAVSAAEENLLDLPGDPYRQENILIHELAHAIHERGMLTVDPSFDGRLAAAYDHARKKGLWSGTYAAQNRMEYWAEATQSWFDCNRVNDADHGPIDTREKLVPYDPDVATLLREVYGDKPWRYAKPSRRPASERAHLQGFDAKSAGGFVWPASVPPLAQASGEPLRWLTLSNIPRVSPASQRETSVRFVNHRAEEVIVEWLAFDGRRTPYATVHAGDSLMQPTFAGHVWIVSTRLRVLGAVIASDGPGVADIR